MKMQRLVKEKRIKEFIESIPDEVLMIAHITGKDKKSDLVAERYGIDGLNVYLEAIRFDYYHPSAPFKVTRALEREFGV